MEKPLCNIQKALKTRIEIAHLQAQDNPDFLESSLRSEMASFAHMLPGLLAQDCITKYHGTPIVNYDVRTSQIQPQPQTIKHTVKKDEDLSSISQKYKVIVDDLLQWNRQSAKTIQPGQELMLIHNPKLYEVHISLDYRSHGIGILHPDVLAVNQEVMRQGYGGVGIGIMDVYFFVRHLNASGLQIIQTVMKKQNANIIGKYHWKYQGVMWDAFVDSGKNSPWAKNYGHGLAIFPGKPYSIPSTDVHHDLKSIENGYGYNESNICGTEAVVHIHDKPNAIFHNEECYFETIIVATNYAGSGKDKVLGSFQWGYKSFGKVLTFNDNINGGIKLNSKASPEALQIIKFDYPDYQLYNQ